MKLTRDDLKGKGIYNSHIDFDSRLHIDPALFEAIGIPEFKDAKKKIILYFAEILRLIKASSKEGDIFWKKAFSRLCFGEGLNTSLGYSKRGSQGSGIGPKTAISIIATVKQIQTAGVNDPEIFELVGIFEENVGPDRISDMISVVLRNEFCLYTQRLSKELNIKTRKYKIGGIIYELPRNPINEEPLIFVPRKILNDLPIADSWEDIPIAASYSQEIRAKLNSMLGGSWKEVAKIKKSKLKEILIEHPYLLVELLLIYKKKAKVGYDFQVDHLGELLWDILGENITVEKPLDLASLSPVSDDNIKEVVIAICNQFRELIENNGLVDHLYDSNSKRRPERFPQLLFFGIADSYCIANNLDLSREPNAGSGALDFKVSRGSKKVNVEVKYSSNQKLVDGYEVQLPAYNRAEKARHCDSVYLVIRTNDKGDYKLRIIESIIEERRRKSIPSPTLIVVNGIKQPSASKR